MTEPEPEEAKPPEPSQPRPQLQAPSGIGAPFGINFQQVNQQLNLFNAPWERPIPPPGALAQYEAIQSGLAGRIVAMAEGELKHRQDEERRLNTADIDQARNAQWFAMCFATVTAVSGIVLLFLGRDVAGGILFGLPVVGTVQAFLRRRGGDRRYRSKP